MPEQSPTEWMVNAVRRGLQPAHGAQALARAGAFRHSRRGWQPYEDCRQIAAQALGLPSLPGRLAFAALSVARSVGRALSR